MLVEIYTDGANSMKRKQGGWGVYAKCGDQELKLSGHAIDTTNNLMELEAMRQGLLLAHTLAEVDPSLEVLIISDSEYVLLGIQEYLPSWKASNWKKGKLKNLETDW